MSGDPSVRPPHARHCTWRYGARHPENEGPRRISPPRHRGAGARGAEGLYGPVRWVRVLGLLLALVAVAGPGCAGRRGAAPGDKPGRARATPTPDPTPLAGAEPVHVAPLRSGQFRVCAFAFHSPDELAAIKAALPAKDFVFTDLSPVFPGGVDSTGSTLSRLTPGWFADRCRPDLSCDIVVYSGEFGGAFFGSYGYYLTIQEMEEASCQARCKGLFGDPREVFLMACNTLATKSADRRTPEEYRHVLLTHGYSHADADRVVAMRYGPLGPSFRESLRRMFTGVPRIYGFSTVAPLGVSTAPRLRQYFRRKGDYAKYLERAGRDSAPNKDLLTAFAGMGMVQAKGVTALEPTGADRDLVCGLYDDSQTVAERLRVMRQMLSRKDFLSFVPTIEVFLGRHPPEQYSDAERRLLRDIQSLEDTRRQVTELVDRLELSVVKMQMANLARQLTWITPAEHEELAAEGLKQLLAEPLSTEVADIGCELSKYVPTGAGLRSEDIPDQLLWHSEGYRVLACLAPADPRVTVRMLQGLENIDASTRQWAAYALWKRRPLDDEVLVAMAPSLDDSSAEVRERVLQTFEAEVPLSPRVLTAIRDGDPDLAATLEARGED